MHNKSNNNTHKHPHVVWPAVIGNFWGCWSADDAEWVILEPTRSFLMLVWPMLHTDEERAGFKLQLNCVLNPSASYRIEVDDKLHWDSMLNEDLKSFEAELSEILSRCYTL